jgi:hypothetical protein
VVSPGVDTFKLTTNDFPKMPAFISRRQRPTLFVSLGNRNNSDEPGT